MSIVPPFLLLDRYEVTEEIGRGGHATVYRAHDRVLSRDVAVKVLRDEALSPDTLARFRKEIQVTAQLEHAHILHVYDTGTFEGRPYIVMELATGRTLADRLERERQLPVDEALQIARDVGLALAHAHARGVIHRDIKPENVLLAAGGAILADFGIARVTTEGIAEKLTSTGVAVGTVQYMSPEQLCAEPGIDARSDQYSLACVLYEMLAGVRPHISATVEGLRMLRITGRHEPVSTHRPSVPVHVNAAVQRALCSMPADRFRSIEELLAALGMGVTGEGSAASDANAVHRGNTPSPPPASTGYWIKPTIVAAVSLAAAAAGLSAWRAGSASGNEADPTATRVVIPPVRGADRDGSALSGRVHAALQAEVGVWPDLRLLAEVPRGDTAALVIVPTATPLGDSVRIALDVRRGKDRQSLHLETFLAQEAVAVPGSLNDAMRSLVRQALGGMSIDDAPGIDMLPDRSMTALRSYAQGFRDMRSGRIAAASTQFRAASTASRRFAHAAFWSAQTNAWSSPRDVTTRRAEIETAIATGSLHGVDSLLAVALRHMTRMEFPEACNEYRAATESDATSFEAWYGLGECVRLDSVVVSSPVGLRFRSSHWAALSSYRRAVGNARTPEWLGALFPSIMRTSYAVASQSRAGRGSDSAKTRYFALPSRVNDTLAFFPLSEAQFRAGGAGAVPESWTGALKRGRQVALDITGEWVTRAADSPHAWLYRAIALELAGQIDRNGEQSADAALDRVERRNPSSEQRAQAMVARVRVALRRGDISGALETSRAAVAAARTLSTSERAILAPLAALLDDVPLAQEYSRRGREIDVTLPAVLGDSLHAFTVAAALGSCDRLDTRKRALDEQFLSTTAEADRTAMRKQWLVPAYRTAVPCLGPAAIAGLTPELPLDSVFVALAADDHAGALSILRNVRSRRTGATAASISWDYLFAESWALAQAGDTVTARKQLLAALDDIAELNLYTLDLVSHVGGLRRGMLLLRDMRARARAGEQVTASERIWLERAGILESPSRNRTQ